MNGYLMQEREWAPGEDLFLESLAPENRYGVVLEDDGETVYFYAVEKDAEGGGVRILDALHILQHGEDGEESGENGGAGSKPVNVRIVWSRDWLKCALVLDGYCVALFDFEAHGGYNLNEFPPPNETWTQGDRKLTDERIQKAF